MHTYLDCIRNANAYIINPLGNSCLSAFGVQLMDKCINKPFKESMRASWLAWMLEDGALIKAGNLEQSTPQDAINWVSEAWTCIKVEILVQLLSGQCVDCPMLWMVQKMTL